jgi:hypothetical protein
LTLPELKTLNNNIIQGWSEFVENAPASWKKDEWITSRSPVGVVCLYGQNQPIVTSAESMANEMNNWRTSRDYSKAKWLSYGVTTNFE